MPELETTSITEKYRDRCEDRVEVIVNKRRTIIVVADGAGGTGAGHVAAEQLVSLVRSSYHEIHSANEWMRFLSQSDMQIGSGQTTGLIVDIRPFGVAGASVGDSEAWIFENDNVFRLTENQIRKPLLGSGNVVPTGFQHESLSGILLAGTDGLFNYAKPDDLIRTVAQCNFIEVPRKLVDLVRLPSGDLWDDIGIVAARPVVKLRSRKRYEI